MTKPGDILGEGREPERPQVSLTKMFAASAARTADMEQRSASARLTGLLGPIAWAVYEHGKGRISMGQASEIALDAMRMVGSETITVVGYVQLTKKACEIAEKILEEEG